MSIRAALVGTGIFSKDVYARVFAKHAADVSLHHVWSRNLAAAEAFAKQYADKAHVSHGDDGLSSILHDPEIQLVVVVLPVQAALKVVQDALAAGKHVIEEKPVAGTFGEALDSIRKYRDLQQLSAGPAPLWMFAENFRYEEVFEEACAMAPGLLGSVVKLDLVANMVMDSTNKYYGSSWRRDTAGCPGGMIMESSVHFVAALRMLARACGLGEATEVSARSSHTKPDLSDPDTVVGVVAFEIGKAKASVSITMAATMLDWSLQVVGTEGSLQVTRGGWSGSRTGYNLIWKKNGEAEPQRKAFPFTGVDAEFAAFLKLVSMHSQSSVVSSAEEQRASPEEGARDLALVEALLLSGALGGSPVKVQAV